VELAPVVGQQANGSIPLAEPLRQSAGLAPAR
jgi:hypothetical protein